MSPRVLAAPRTPIAPGEIQGWRPGQVVSFAGALLAMALGGASLACGRTPDAGQSDELDSSGVASSFPSTRIHERTYRADSPSLAHLIGAQDPAGWRVRPPTPGGSFLTYGPYERALAPGRYKVTFEFIMRSLGTVRGKVMRLDVYVLERNQTLAARDVQWFEFGDTLEPHPFSLVFDNPGDVAVEFRVLWHGGTDVTHTRTSVRAIDEGSVGRLWGGTQAFEAARGVRPSWIAVKDGAWHLYDRQYDAVPAGVTLEQAQQACTQGIVGVNYAFSTHKRAQETNRRTVLWPSVNPARPDACMVLDGATFFDGTDAQGRAVALDRPWHMLAQCLPTPHGPMLGWHLCHYTAPSPEGPFTLHLDHTVKPGQLWDEICSGPGKSCSSAPRVVDEGTPEFLFKRDGHLYFTFHGYDGVRGYRGVARTRDFITWQTRGPHLPGDAMFSPRDCTGANPACIGFGASSIIKSGDYYYALGEAPTKNLACTPGQEWPVLLLRSVELSRSGAWESFPGNPFLRDPFHEAQPNASYCGIQYARWIEDDNADVYLQYQDTFARMTWLQRLARTPPVRQYQGAELHHLIGRAQGTGWSVHVGDGPGWLAYGPYASDWPETLTTAAFELVVDNNTADDGSVVRLDVFDATAQEILASRTLRRTEMATAYATGVFSLGFSNQGRAGHAMEVRVHAAGISYVRLERVVLY